MKPIYLDYNATTPIDPQVAEVMLPFIHTHCGNPSSAHAFGIIARRAVEKARQQIADMLHADIQEIIITSGGTEANNHAIKGVARACRAKGNHIITSSVEHPAVIEVCRYLEEDGFQVTYLPVDGHGWVDPQTVEDAISPRTVLISIMHANNEVGTVEPIKEIAEIAHRNGVFLHTDAAQSVGKIPVHVDQLDVDLLSVAGHKIYAPKGIGALYVRAGVQVEKLIHGAPHEMNRRAGTENVIGIVGLGKACELVDRYLLTYSEHMQKMRDRLEAGLMNRFPQIRINGHPEKRLPNTSNISFKGLEANIILSKLRGIAVSSGAACHGRRTDLSSVLKAMKVPIEYAMGTLRFSVGRFTTPSEIEQALVEISSAIERLNLQSAASRTYSNP